jgi:3-isopropylmalate/(R)-2-methylmalate dehydratase large subunit
MSGTIAETILARAANRAAVKPGEYVWARVDQTNACPEHLQLLHELGVDELWDPEKVWSVSDHYAPPTDEHYANQDNILRRYVRHYEVAHFFEYGRHGIAHQLFGEHGALLPGTLSAMSDSHSTSGGVFNCFATPIGGEVSFVMATGLLWLRVPETIRIDLDGELGLGCYGKDVVLGLLREHGSDVGIYKALEFGGSGLRSMTIDSRWTLANMGIEMGAKAAICEYDDRLGDYLAQRTDVPYEPAVADPDCTYEQRYAFLLSDVEPLVACPHDPANVRAARDLEAESISIDQAFLGSCTNGRAEDLEVAARMLKGRQIHPSVRMIVSPASQNVWKEALKQGWLQILAEAGALVAHSTCGPCLGAHLGVLGDGDVCISSSNRNFKGRMGSGDSFVYLANAATVTAAAITGKIIDPRRLLV